MPATSPSTARTSAASTASAANYFAVAPLTVLQDVVRFFHLGLTVDFARPLVQALNWLAFGLLLLGVWAAARPWPTAARSF